MADLLIDLIVLWAVSLLSGLALLGWGRIVRRLVGLSLPNRPDVGTVWLGLVLMMGLIEGLQLFVRIDWRASVFFALVGILSCCLAPSLVWKGAWNELIGSMRANRALVTVLMALFVVWSLRAMGVPNNFDSGLYHFASIRWINEYPLVPGIGNLHWRLALNQSYFGFLALLNLDPLWGKGYAAGGLLLLGLTIATAAEVATRLDAIWRRLVVSVLLIYLCHLASGLANPAPDGAVAVIQVAIFLFLWRGAVEMYSATDREPVSAIVVLALSLALVMIKLSGAAFGLTSGILACWIWRREIFSNRRLMLRLSILLVAIVTLHLVRGVLLSGYPLFPSTWGGIPSLDWAMQPEVLRYESDLIRSWARAPGELNHALVLGTQDWIFAWVVGLPAAVRLMLAVSVLFSAGALIYLAFGRRIMPQVRRAAALYLPLVCSGTFWFLTAPDPRFLGAVPTLMFALSLWVLLWSAPLGAFGRAIATTALRAPLMIALSLAVCLFSIKMVGLRSVSISGWSAIPAPELQVRETDSGLKVLVPVERGQCWDAPLPCAPVLNPGLFGAGWSLGTNGDLSLWGRPQFRTKSTLAR